MNHEQMQMEFVRKLPIPQEIKKQFPISEKIAQHKAESIPISPGQQAKATRACSTSRTLRNSRIFWKA